LKSLSLSETHLCDREQLLFTSLGFVKVLGFQEGPVEKERAWEVGKRAPTSPHLTMLDRSSHFPTRHNSGQLAICVGEEKGSSVVSAVPRHVKKQVWGSSHSKRAISDRQLPVGEGRARDVLSCGPGCRIA
jgi:hypothetical protein